MQTDHIALAASSPLVKHTIADTLKDEILRGALRPGDRVVEGKWASDLGVAQGSVREALNILAAEGFVEKEPGRVATVTLLTRSDIVHLYEVRAVLEGLAARLLVSQRADLTDLHQSIADMHAASEQRNVKAVIDRDLRFHLLFCQKSGNPFLAQHARRLLVPLFAFSAMRAVQRSIGTETWARDLDRHRRILDLIQLGDADIAERFASNSIAQFARRALEDWVET